MKKILTVIAVMVASLSFAQSIEYSKAEEMLTDSLDNVISLSFEYSDIKIEIAEKELRIIKVSKLEKSLTVDFYSILEYKFKRGMHVYRVVSEDIIYVVHIPTQKKYYSSIAVLNSNRVTYFSGKRK